jgi:hypothetical protein
MGLPAPQRGETDDGPVHRLLDCPPHRPRDREVQRGTRRGVAGSPGKLDDPRVGAAQLRVRGLVDHAEPLGSEV